MGSIQDDLVLGGRLSGGDLLLDMMEVMKFLFLFRQLSNHWFATGWTFGGGNRTA